MEEEKTQIIIQDEASKEINIDDDIEKIFGGLFVIQDKDKIIMSRKPDWVKDPRTGEKLNITDMFVTEQEIYCPKCKSHGKLGLICLEKNIIVIACPFCKEFVWTRIKEEF